MTRRRRLRRRLLWAGVLLGLVLLLAAVSALRICAWCRDLLTDNASRTRRAFERKEGTLTRALTLAVGIAIAALAIAPMALGEGRLAPLYPPSQVATYPDAGERAGRSDGLDPAAAAGRLDGVTPIGHPPAVGASLLHLANAAGRLQIPALSKGLAPYRDSGPHRVTTATPPLATTPTYTTSPGKSGPAKLAAIRTATMRAAAAQGAHEAGARATPGRHVDWSQIGIGVAIGMALAIGLGLAVQTVRARPLAH